MKCNLKNKITAIIKDLNLNLNGKIVLTEAATGPYAVTPLIASLSGADVYAYAKDSKYGSAKDVFDALSKIINDFSAMNIKLVHNLNSEIIAKADIITNSGHLRPLDKEKLQYVKEGVVIPLMYEAWEIRNSDIDIDYCKLKNILIGGTNERHPDVGVFNYLGDMAIKLIFDSGLCLHNNKFVIICNNEFGNNIANKLVKICSGIGVIDRIENKERYNNKVDWLGSFPCCEITEKYFNAEAIILATYPFNKIWIGADAEIQAEDLINKFRSPLILRFTGDIDENYLKIKGIPFFPYKVESGHMGILPSSLGYDSVIRLQAAGLKVGQAIIENNYYHNGVRIAELL